MGKPRTKDHVSTATHSLNPDRGKQAKGSTMRTKQTIKRLNMYKNFKAKRDKKGHIVRAAPFQSSTPSGTVSRVEPNRRWFGNTRVISQDALQNFKEAMKLRNPYEIMLRQTILPVSLLDEKKMKRKADILATASFSDTFGKKSKRKKPRLSFDDVGALMRGVISRQHGYMSNNDLNLPKGDSEFRTLVSDPHFKAGTSKRLWNELFKVLDSSDVVLYVLDARDPMGTRSRYIENYMRKEKPHKHFIFIINKVDLVPVWITKRWKMILSAEYPTLVFHASLTKPLGKMALMGLLRQLASLHSKDRHQISVGIIGYPNVGKSSIINAMRSKKVCKVAPLAGETKVWQYVTLLKSIYLIDCPGVVYPDGATESDLVMKGVVRVEYLQQPELYVADVLARVKPEYLQQRYGLPNFDASCRPIPNDFESNQKIVTSTADVKNGALDLLPDEIVQPDSKGETVQNESSIPKWPENVELFLELVSKKTGKLLKGGEPDVIATAKRVLNDFQRGKLPYFVRPPPQDDETVPESENIIPIEENLHKAFSEILASNPDETIDEDNEVLSIKASSDNLVSSADKPVEVDEENGQIVSTADDEVVTVPEHSITFDLEPNTDDEEMLNVEDSKKKNKNTNYSTDESGLSGNRRRQLERALRKQRGRAGRHFYEEVSTKNRRVAAMPPLVSKSGKSSRRLQRIH